MKEKTIYLSNVESSALVIQSMLIGTRMELLDLLDYARDNDIDSVPVQHIQEEVIGLRELEEEEYNDREKRYLEAHKNQHWVSVKERLPSFERDLFGDATHPSVLVLTASLSGAVSVNRWNGREWLYTGDVDYWMPIPELPKGGTI